MDIKAVQTKPYSDQNTGTSGLRRKVSVFRQPNYLENFIQSVFDCLEGFEGKTLVIGGDGRFFGVEAAQTIIKIAVANRFGRIIIGQNGLLSTPATSHVICKYGAFGGLILSASHNPGGPDADFGIKYDCANGGAALPTLTDKFVARTKTIDRYWIADMPDVDLSAIRSLEIGGTTIDIIDPVADYVDYMQEIFDFKAIKRLFASGFTMTYDAMNAITGPYAHRLFEEILGAPKGTVIHGKPLPDFGGLHPEPNLTYAKHLVDLMHSDKATDFAAASDGDGDRYMILGRHFFVNPCDSLAILAEYIETLPFYQGRMYGVARSMPTAPAVDLVAENKGYACYQTPTGWKFFGSLLDARKITLCGEESFGGGSCHLNEKDGLWAILFWLNILAVTGKTPEELCHDLWRRYGRIYALCHNYTGLEADKAAQMMTTLADKMPNLVGKSVAGLTVQEAFTFDYTDPVTNETAKNQGFCFYFDQHTRIVMRLSGTDAAGATLRIYMNKLVLDAKHFDADPTEMMADLIAAARALSDIKTYAGDDTPTSIT